MLAYAQLMPTRSAELTIGRTFGVTMDHGDEFMATLSQFCAEQGIKYGYIPLFVGAFKHAKVVGTCRHAEAEAPMFDHYMDLDFVETVGAGTIGFDADNNRVTSHIHLSMGKRLHSADGVTSHLFEAEIQFLLEMIVVEVTAPAMTRPVSPELFNLNLLHFSSNSGS
jgi:predicted DNA-binding protein with PD1-like motif